MIEHLAGIRDRRRWPGLTTVGMCLRERTIDGRTSTEVCYFIGSRRMGARRYPQALRSHWGIENNLHWQLDVSFREDASRIENRHEAANFALLRKGSWRWPCSSAMVVELARTLSRAGVRLHAFGVKATGLRRAGRYLASADSLAWSFAARRQGLRLAGCTHPGPCNNCLAWALRWRRRVVRAATAGQRS